MKTIESLFQRTRYFPTSAPRLTFDTVAEILYSLLNNNCEVSNSTTGNLTSLSMRS